jgi:hypothetical protein
MSRVQFRMTVFGFVFLAYLSVTRSFGAVDFIQLTDPHLFGEQSEHERALGDAIYTINERVEKGAQYRFVVVTGDLGVEDLVSNDTRTDEEKAQRKFKPREMKTDADAQLTSGAHKLAELIAPSKVKLWMFVPGNNDLIDEDPNKGSYYTRFIEALKANLHNAGVAVIDLSERTTDPKSGTYMEGRFAFIGFNNASFKGNDLAKNAADWEPAEKKEIEEVKKQVAIGDYIYIFYHIPEIDDPYYVSLDPKKKNENDRLNEWLEKRGVQTDSLKFSAWTVQPAVRDAWNELIKDQKVRGLFAGHFHDWRKETYRGFQWMRSVDYPSASLLKLLICPPLAVKQQTTTPAQARGFREVSIADDGKVTSRIFWYDKGFELDSDIAAQPLFPQQTVTLAVDAASNTASGIIYLHNSRREELPVSLSAEDFRSLTTNKGLNAKVLFSAVGQTTAGQQIYETRIPPQSTTSLRLDLTNFWEAGEATARLFNYAEPIGTVRGFKSKPPFLVKLVVPTPDNPELEFTKGQTRRFTLKNDDAMTYVVRTSVEIGGVTVNGGTVTLPPNGNASVDVKPEDAWFGASGFFRSDRREGTVTLRFEPPGATSDSGFPVKVLPLKAKLNSTSSGWQTLWSYFFVFFLITLGGICSLILSNWVPNRMSRTNLEERLEDLARRTRDLSDRVDSGLRVLLSVERKRIRATLHSRYTIGAQFAEIYKKCSDKTDLLEKQIELTARIDRAYTELEGLKIADAIPRKCTQVRDELKRAADILRRPDPSLDDLDKAKGRIEVAIDRLAKMKEADPAFSDDLDNRIARLKSYFKEPTVANFQQEYKDQDFDLNGVIQKLPAPKSIQPADYATSDMEVCQLELLQNYCEIDAQKRANHAKKFFARLEKKTLRGLEEADAYLAQLREGKFKEDIKTAIEQKRLEIRVEPKPIEDRLVKFSVQFADEDLNTAASRQEISPEWNFGHDDLKEKGWEAFHYFPRSKTRNTNPYDVRVTFWSDGEQLKPQSNKSNSDAVCKKVTVDKAPTTADQNVAELVRLAIALLIALTGLLAGGQEQLAKLDLVPAALAVFLLGFGADAIKNLLSPKQSPQK